MPETLIEWTATLLPDGQVLPGYTFNPWRGCEKVSPACDRCYAETWAKRTGKRIWGKDAPREFAAPSYWRKPLQWEEEAAGSGIRRKVFCASLADVFEDRRDLDDSRSILWNLIERTPHLDWLILTKRPENIRKLARPSWLDAPRPNVWWGLTAENRRRFQERIIHFAGLPAAVRFVSYEPALGDVSEDLGEYSDLVDWLILGGESGPGARTTPIEWLRAVSDSCLKLGIPRFVKQLGAKPTVNYYDDFRDVWMEEFGFEWPDPINWSIEHDGQPPLDSRVILPMGSRKGGDMKYWPEELRVREYPEAR